LAPQKVPAQHCASPVHIAPQQAGGRQVAALHDRGVTARSCARARSAGGGGAASIGVGPLSQPATRSSTTVHRIARI
jgi:hypothetical protein